MPGATAAGSPSKYITAALADLFSCIGGGDIVSAKALLEGKHKNDKEAILSATNPAGITLLQHACHSGQAGGVNMLLEKGADPNWTSTKGSTPLHFACNNGHFDCAEALLRAGVDVDAGNANGTTPLIIAAFGAHASCVRLLLEHDADPNVRDKLGRRAGDSLCGTINAVSGRVGGAGAGGGSGSAAGGIGASAMNSGGATQGAQTENEPFSETRSLLAVARAQRSTRRGRSDSTASSCTATTSTACVHVKSQSRDRDADAVSGSAVSGNAVCTHGGTAGMLRAMHSTGAGSAGHVGDDHGPDGLERSPTLPTAAEGTSKDARLASAKLPPPSGLVIGNPSGDMATGVGHSTCSSSAGTTTNVSGNGIGSVGSGRACNRAAQVTMPLSPANTAASDSVPSVLAAAAVAAAATSRPSSTVTVAGAASLSGEATPPTLANSPRTTPMPSPAPSPLRASKLSASASSSSSSVLSPQLQQSQPQLSSHESSAPTFPSPLSASAPASAPASASAATDPELDHPSLQSKRSADLKAALAANAAMIRSMQEEERTFSAQRDLLERRRGEAGARRKGAEEHAAVLRAQAGELARKDAPGTPLTPVTGGGGGRAGGAANTPAASVQGDAGSGRPPEQPPVLMPPSPISDGSNNNAASSVFNTPTRGAAAGEGEGGGGPSPFSTVSPPTVSPAASPAPAAMAVADGSSAPATPTRRGSRTIPPVPAFTGPPKEEPQQGHAAAATAVPAGAVDDDGSPSVMEDEEEDEEEGGPREGERGHPHRQQARQQQQQEQQQQQQQQQRQYFFSPDRGADASSRSPFRSNSTQRRQLELRLQSPLRTGVRCGGGGDVGLGRDDRDTSSVCRRPQSNNNSLSAATSERHHHQRQHQRHAEPEDTNAEMVEVGDGGTEGGNGGGGGGGVPGFSEAIRGVAMEGREHGSGSDASTSTAEVLEAQSRRVQELEAELRATRRDNRYRDGRSQRSRTNANKRQRAGTTSLSSQRLQHSHSDAATDGNRGNHGHQEGTNQCFSPRGVRITNVTSSSPSSSSSLSDPMSPGLRSEVRRLRAEAAARGREHASLAAQHASLVLEKARQAGVLRNRVASADGEVERLSRKLREAQEKLEAQERESEALRRQAEGQQGLLHSRSHVLEQALGRLENIGVALAEERSLHSARSHDNGLAPQANGGDGATAADGANGAPVDAAVSNAVSSNTGGIASGGSAEHEGMASSVEQEEEAPSMSVDEHDDNDDGSNDDDDDNTNNNNNNNNNNNDIAGNGGDAAGIEGGGNAPSAVGGGSDGDGPANANARANSGREEGYEEDGRAGSEPMRDVGVEENEAAAGAAADGAVGASVASVMAAAGERVEDRPQGGLEMARIFSHQQIDAACAGFPDSAIVGRGGFGPVFRGRFMGGDVAVKRLDGYGLQGLPNFLKEVQVLTTCRHEHLVPLLGICVDPTPMLVYPFVGQSLEWHLREPQRRAAIGWRTRLSVALSVSKGLQYLHQPQAGAWGKPVIVHRDVKTENILMDSNLRARLSDVGIARQLDGAGSEASTRLIGTWGYIDPEYQETGVLTPASDVYSLGVVFLELLTGLPAHSAQLRPSCLVDRVNGKQLSDCLDSACSWPDTPPVVSFAKEAWQCVSRQGDGRPRLQHLIERMERLDLGDDAGGGAGTAAAGNGDSIGAGAAESASNASMLATPLPAPTPVSSTAPPPGGVVGPGLPGSSIAASAAAVAAASAAATAARAATEAAAAAAAAVASGASSLMPPQPQMPPESQSAPAAPSPAMADAAAGGAVAAAASSPMAAPSPSPEAGRDCMICASAPVQTRFLPCRHSLACSSCASLLRARGDRCPVDRARIIAFETGQFQVTYTGD